MGLGRIAEDIIFGLIDLLKPRKTDEEKAPDAQQKKTSGSGENISLRKTEKEQGLAAKQEKTSAPDAIISERKSTPSINVRRFIAKYHKNYDFPAFSCAEFGKYEYSDRKTESEFSKLKNECLKISDNIKNNIKFLNTYPEDVVKRQPDAAATIFKENEPILKKKLEESENAMSYLKALLKCFDLTEGTAYDTYYSLKNAFFALSKEGYDVLTGEMPSDLKWINPGDDWFLYKANPETTICTTPFRIAVFRKNSLVSFCSLDAFEYEVSDYDGKCRITVSVCGTKSDYIVSSDNAAVDLFDSKKEDFMSAVLDLTNILRLYAPENETINWIQADLFIYGLKSIPENE